MSSTDYQDDPSLGRTGLSSWDSSPDVNDSPQHFQHDNISLKRKREATASASVSSSSSAAPVRGVANLTPDQLARKRQNDREAQRAIRERTKGLITQLQDRVKELEEAQPQQQLQAALRMRDSVDRENRRIRDQLSTVMPLLQSVLDDAEKGRTMIVHGTLPVREIVPTSALSVPVPVPVPEGGGGTWTDGRQRPQLAHIPLPPRGWPPGVETSLGGGAAIRIPPATITPTGYFPGAGAGAAGATASSPSPSFPPSSSSTLNPYNPPLLPPPSQSNLSSTGTGTGTTSSSPQFPSGWSNTAMPGPPTRLTSPLPPLGTAPTIGNQYHDQRLALDFLLGDTQQLVPSSENAMDRIGVRLNRGPIWGGGKPDFLTSGTVPEHAVLPRYVKPVCPLDSILWNFLRERHGMIKQGVPLSIVLGPQYPNYGPLLAGCRAATAAAAAAKAGGGVYVPPPVQHFPAHPLSSIFVDIIHTFPDLDRLPEQIAIIYVHFLLMRWQIAPTQEHYDNLPEWIRPRPSQLFSPHPIWMHGVPWPLLRDRMVQMDPVVPFETFFVPFTADFSVNWPYDPEECLIPVRPVPGLGQGPGSAGQYPCNGLPSPSSPTSSAVGCSPGNQSAAGSGVGSSSSAAAASNMAMLQGPWALNPVFEEHLMDLSKWSLGEKFKHTFPDLWPLVRLY